MKILAFELIKLISAGQCESTTSVPGVGSDGHHRRLPVALPAGDAGPRAAADAAGRRRLRQGPKILPVPVLRQRKVRRRGEHAGAGGPQHLLQGGLEQGVRSRLHPRRGVPLEHDPALVAAPPKLEARLQGGRRRRGGPHQVPRAPRPRPARETAILERAEKTLPRLKVAFAQL